MKIFVVDVRKVFEVMHFVDNDKNQLDQWKHDLEASLKSFEERVESYRSIAESTLVVDENVRQKAIMDYQADAEKTKTAADIAKRDIDTLAKEINSKMKQAFDDAVAEVTKSFTPDYIVIPAESTLAFDCSESDGTISGDITNIVCATMKRQTN